MVAECITDAVPEPARGKAGIFNFGTSRIEQGLSMKFVPVIPVPVGVAHHCQSR